MWILAEQLRVPAIITMVTYAMTIARDVGGRMDARRRIASFVVWDVSVRVLNVLAFVLIGLQLRGILGRIREGELRTYALCAAAACATVIVIRVCWVMLHVAGMSWDLRRRHVQNASPRRVPASWSPGPGCAGSSGSRRRWPCLSTGQPFLTGT